MTNTSEIYEAYQKCNGVSIDSRTIERGQMFFALKGPNFDGHKYVKNALEAGARFCIIDDKSYLKHTNTIVVDDCEIALQNLAKYHRCKLNIPFIGLTGSNGKTTTKELMASVLRQKYRTFATQGNLNNHLGVPISVLSVTSDHEMAIIEMGANHIGEIEFLSEIAMPEYGLITNIGKAHLEGFGSILGVQQGKTELYRYLRKINGTIFYNTADQRLLDSTLLSDKLIPYNTKDVKIDSEFPLLSLQYRGLTYNVNLSGGYNASNVLAAITVGSYFDIDPENCQRGIEDYFPSNNRSQIKRTNTNTLILDGYNANPSSMKVSIDNISNANAKNKILIIGHMLELGDDSKEEHQKLISHIDEHKNLWSSVFLIGAKFEECDIPKDMRYFKDTNATILQIKHTPIINSTILLKGSRGIALEKLIPYL